MQIHFTRHLVETIDRIRYAVHQFETFTHDLVDRDSGKCELQTISVNPTRGKLPEQKKILTLAAATKASFHELLANVALIHSLKSGVAARESRAARGVGASSLLPGVERHR